MAGGEGWGSGVERQGRGLAMQSAGQRTESSEKSAEGVDRCSQTLQAACGRTWPPSASRRSRGVHVAVVAAARVLHRRQPLDVAAAQALLAHLAVAQELHHLQGWVGGWGRVRRVREGGGTRMRPVECSKRRKRPVSTAKTRTCTAPARAPHPAAARPSPAPREAPAPRSGTGAGRGGGRWTAW